MTLERLRRSRPLGVGLANDLCEPAAVATITALAERQLVQYLVVYEYDNYPPAWSDGVRARLPGGLQYVWHGSGDLELPLADDCLSANLGRIEAVSDRWGPAWFTEDLIVTSFGRTAVCGSPNYVPLFLTEDALEVCIARTIDASNRMPVPLVPEIPHFYCPVPETMSLTTFFRRYCSATGIGINLDVGHLFSYNLLHGDPATHALDELPFDHIVEINTSGGMIGDRAGRTWIDDYTAPLNPYILDILADVIPACPNLKGLYTETIWADPAVVEANAAALNELL